MSMLRKSDVIHVDDVMQMDTLSKYLLLTRLTPEPRDPLLSQHN